MFHFKEIQHRLLGQIRQSYQYIFPSALSLPIQQNRISVISERIRLLAGVLVVCIPAWAMLDRFAFAHDLWLSLLMARGLVGLAFVSFLLAGKYLRQDSMRSITSIYVQLGIIFVVPTLFYIFCTTLPEQIVESTPFAAAIIYSYRLLPFVILAGLGFFPLTFLESAGIVTPFLASYYIIQGAPDIAHWSDNLGILWSLTLVAGIVMIVSRSQLSMLIRMVSYSAYDPLTHCLGRRSGEEIIRAMWHYSKRNNTHLSLAFIDLDHFKLVNDCFGHQVGDAVLADVAASIKASLRESDFVIRWGGEEFLLLLPDANIVDATAVLKRLSQKGLAVRPDQSIQRVSAGIAERIHEQVDDHKRMIEIADQRLYQAKIAGRSRIVGAETVVLPS